MKSVNLLEVEYQCISIMLYKGKSPPPLPGKGVGGLESFEPEIYLCMQKHSCVPP